MNIPHPHVCLIHGWAANRHVFNTILPQLPADWHLYTPDLPGHGAAAPTDTFDIAQAADTLAAMLPDHGFVAGWSLGGLVALYLAQRHSQKVKKLCLISSFAKFLATNDYPEGLSNPALGKMIALFRQDYPKYMRQFLELQLLHTENRREILAQIMPDITQYGTPSALESALDALSCADARPFLADIAVPTRLIYGGKDSITPPRMGEYLVHHLPNAKLTLIDKAAHAPFLSHAAEFGTALREWVELNS